MMMRMTEFDADRDGKLTLPEFEALHGAMMRETMVDRFQHLDADGDGRITQDEMSAPAQRLQRTPGAAATPGMMGGQMPPAGN
ncbi:MAG: EF-hand domain-containing protein [Roseivivax sp.]|nr:EF-hand domain-containing protein [Roseivivax sp.]